jgi:uncharacterized membrane protein YidH (DUF202 family)
MPVDTEVRIPDGTDLPAQWAGNLLAPIAFLVQLEIAYMVVPRACDTGVVFPVHLAHAGAVLIALAGTIIAWRQWQRWRPQGSTDEPGPESRSLFMAMLALLVSGAFLLVMLALWLPTFFVHPCQ